jgi:NAD(P)-dependent dehydrogenase (short-subunit alcohol dehydrogenase family)
MTELRGRRILVTAGARRLGAALAVDLAAAGAHVAVTYRSSRADADDVVGRIRALGVGGHAIEVDLADGLAARAAVHEAADRLEGLDGVVHCASAGFRPTPLAELTPDDFEEAIGATLRGGLFVAQGAAERLGPGGAIVFIGDVAAVHGWPAYLPHSAAKAGLRALTSGLARALGPAGIRVAIVHPGTVLPPADADPAALQAEAERLPLRRLGSPDDVAGAVRYLLCAPFVTGAELLVDGGRLIR